MTEEIHDEYQVCYKHPDRKTLLRCNKCGKPICMECAVQTPTGYRCKDCVKAQQKVFDTAEKRDYIIGGLIAAVLGLAGAIVSQLIPFLPTYITALIVSVLFGQLICTAVRKAVSRRRSVLLTRVVVIAAGLGAVIGLWQNIIVNVSILGWGMSELSMNSLLQIVIDIAYVAIQSWTISSNMNGMVFRR